MGEIIQVQMCLLDTFIFNGTKLLNVMLSNRTFMGTRNGIRLYILFKRHFTVKI